MRTVFSWCPALFAFVSCRFKLDRESDTSQSRSENQLRSVAIVMIPIPENDSATENAIFGRRKQKIWHEDFARTRFAF
jgi:hypothetical protein